ncbi:glycosyltransferase [Sinomonas sp. R1AF57]|uniref:glycosyltransferase n=1 Tax=Sinomonas sp. R1AF57 TaxID=2020377 RepID=UPI000B5F86DD|nr:glycosyltransferase [Sinomonas sp. R1AF57]ASN51483.1 hypothetical protein CGQ25_04845 [Sinomonas sp. R1AF57]
MSEPVHDHVLLTRFNLPSRGFESSVRSREGWLESRIGLFERYCLTSVSGQSDRDFAWIVYFDPESPTWLRELIEKWQGRGNLTPIFRASVSAADLQHDLRCVSGSGRERLLTTNLDNDDALSSDFIARHRALSLTGGATAVYLAHGLIARGEKLYRRTDRANAFCSVSAPWSAPETCWADWHNALGDHMPVVLKYDQPAWLQVVHGRNVSNRVHGTLTSPSRYAGLFPHLLDDMPEPTTTDLAKDRMVGVPVRFVREAGRAAAKRAIVAAAGRDGLDTVRRTAHRAEALSGPREKGDRT